MDNLQLSELAQKAKDGDMSAFEKIYSKLSPEIYAIAYEITQNKEESHDLVQDCFLAAMENIRTLNEPDKIKNWLIRIAANKSRDYIKKKRPSVLTEDQYCIIENLEEDDITVIPEASLEAEERIEDVNEILQTLTEDKRLCLLLRYKHDMSYAEIADELGITESAVKSRISRAKDDIEKEAEKRKKKGLPLFGIAPFGLVIFALKKSAEITAASFAGSAAQTAAFAGISAASQAGIAASTTAASATASAASTTATAATGIGAKVAAMSVAQKVVAGVAAASIVTGSATVTTVVVKNKIESETTTTAYVEEVTTAPDYGFESETVFIPAVAETETSVSESQTTKASTSSSIQSSTTAQTKETEKTTVANKTTTQKQTTTKKSTTTKAATTQKPTTTKKETTTKAINTEEETTAKASTTTTTVKASTTATTKATTTTTEAASPATVTVTVWGETSSTTKTLYFEAGETITATEIENRLSNEYGIEAIADDINITAEAGGNYTATAYE